MKNKKNNEIKGKKNKITKTIKKTTNSTINKVVKQEKSPKDILFKIFKIIRNFIFIILACFILVVCLQRFSNNKISFLNYRMFAVISGSMEPKYSIGDVLIAKKVDPGTIKVGQPISYLGNKGSLNGMVITHEVIKIEKDTSGKYYFHAKGLANLVEDPIVTEDQLYGVVVHKTVLLTFIYKIVGTKLGMLIFVFIPIAYIIGSEMIHSMLDREKERRCKHKNS